MMTACMKQFACVNTAVSSDTRSCSAACTNAACARFVLSKKDALAASFFVLVSIIALIMLLAMRLCRLHAILGLLISLIVWMKWSFAEVQRMQLYA